MHWHQLEPASAAERLSTEVDSGLATTEAARRWAEHGPNELSGSGLRNPWRILWEQLTGLMVVILIAAAVISALLGDFKDAIAIGAIVLLNAALGFSQEYRAEKAMAALRKLSVPAARVRRGGAVLEVPSTDLVPGDLVFLEAGNFVAADGRVVESAGLQTLEAALTGESEPIAKVTAALAGDELPLGDRVNMVYRGTFVTAGRGLMLVTATGMKTELGQIARLIQTVDQEMTPLQKRLDHLGRRLAMAALAIVAVIFALGVARGEDLKLMLLTAVSIGVAAVPEGLPAVVTIALTLGAQRMLKRRVLVRRLAAVETLGSVTVICSDKTGTLTQNRMTAESTWVNGDPRLLLTAGALCNDAVLGDAQEMLGDPTEVALAVLAAREGLHKRRLEEEMPRVAEQPFDSTRKRMTTVHDVPAGAVCGVTAQRIAFTKGAFDGLLGVAHSVDIGGRAVPLDDAWRARLKDAHEQLARQGMRVLGIAFRPVERHEGGDYERDLTVAGLVGIIDPPRPEAAAAVATCQSAGIRVVMITGDHPVTAAQIAGQLGIQGVAVTGVELDRGVAPAGASIFARVSPEHKLRIVESLQASGQIVAMTGDGVNDAPALKKADIGVAMGVTGTDVAKEAADMVLLDDNFATIVAAVEEGRVIYDNVRKFIRYILATNSGEIWVMLVAPLLGLPLPLLPLQLLWMNLVTDGLPALALGVEPPDADVMRRPPYPSDESIFSRGLGRHVLWVGLLMGLLSLGVGWWYWSAQHPAWQTMLFTVMTFCQMAHVMAIRSERHSLFAMGIASNPALLTAVASTFLLQLALIYVEPLRQLFKTVALGPGDLALTLALSALVFLAVEGEKWLARRALS